MRLHVQVLSAHDAAGNRGADAPSPQPVLQANGTVSSVHLAPGRLIPPPQPHFHAGIIGESSSRKSPSKVDLKKGVGGPAFGAVLFLLEPLIDAVLMKRVFAFELDNCFLWVHVFVADLALLGFFELVPFHLLGDLPLLPFIVLDHPSFLASGAPQEAAEFILCQQSQTLAFVAFLLF